MHLRFMSAILQACVFFRKIADRLKNFAKKKNFTFDFVLVVVFL